MGEQLVGLGVDDGLLGQLFLFLQYVQLEVAGVGVELAPVQFHDAGGHPVQEAAVMGDGDDAALERDQQVFQPFDGVQVQMVGGLVQQQHVRLRHQGLCQRHALAGTARQRAYDSRGIQMQALQGLFHPLLPVPGVIGLDDGLQRIQVQPFGA